MKALHLRFVSVGLVGLLLTVPPACFARRFVPGRSKVTVPFRTMGGIPVVSLALNGKKRMNFLFDTGAPPVMLDARAAAAAGLMTTPAQGSDETPCGAAPTRGVAAKMRVSGYGMEITGSARVFDLRALSRKLGVRVAGILGFGAMMPAVPMLVDYQAQRITFFVTKRYPQFGKSTEIPLESIPAGKVKISGPVIAAELELPDGKLVKANLLIDTGDGGPDALQLNLPFAKKYGLLPAHPQATGREVTAGGGTCDLVRVSVRALMIGDQKIAYPSTLCAEGPAGSSGSTKFDGQIGDAILSRFRIFFGAHRHFVVFVPAS